ncbi:MAG: ankyrin repeat domain-containing protein [Planctomycetes bacterium]|nr:ankyrin repeat domain-containing protein [Planctomycetota bacterium]
MPVRLLTLVLPLLALLGAGLRPREDAPFPLPKPVATKPPLADERRAELARALCEALDRGDAEAASKALVDGANPNVGMGAGEETTKGRTPLIHAVLAGKAELVDLLLAHGARLDDGDDAKHTPLMYAALTKDLELARHLVRIGARLDAEDREGQVALAYAPEGEPLAQFLADVAAKNTALFERVAAGELKDAWKLVADGASPNANDGKSSLLMAAVRAGDNGLVATLIAGGCRPGLLHAAGFVVETPLGVAAESASLELLRLLLKDTQPGRAALDDALACAAGAERDDRAERVKLLLAAGADPAADMLLQTPALPGAAARGDLATMALLLAAGADQRAVDHALVRAAGVEDEAKALAATRALLAIGANATYEYLFTNALGAAATRGHAQVLEVLFAKTTDEALSCSVSQAAREGSAKGLAWLCERGKGRIDFAHRAGPFDSALIAAIGAGCVDCVKVLLGAGADANQPASSDEDSPLIAAVRARSEPVIQLLLAAGADPEKTWDTIFRGELSALGVAQEEGDAGILALLERGASKATADPARSALTRAKLNFEDIGDYFELPYSDADSNRAQRVFVRKERYEYESLSVHELLSLCYDAKVAPKPDQLVQWFQRRFALGGLVLEAPTEGQENWRIRYRILIASDAPPERWSHYLQLVQGTADALEKEFNPGAEDRL